MVGHLKGIREGWRAEHLAKFILSKFSFIAEPSTISDDLGSDFFCTLFNIEDKKFLSPKNSLAIQIKKKPKSKPLNQIDLTNKRGYVLGLEIPFFIGVVDILNSKLTIYAGEYLGDFTVSGDNSTRKIYARLVEERSDPLKPYEVVGDKVFIDFPKVVELGINYNYENNPEEIKDLFDICKLMQENIASKISNEFIFKRFKSDFFWVYSGNGSAVCYENNFLMRLVEVFRNLIWLYRDARIISKDDLIKDFEIYGKLYESLLKKYNGRLPGLLIKSFNEIKELVK